MVVGNGKLRIVFKYSVKGAIKKVKINRTINLLPLSRINNYCFNSDDDDLSCLDIVENSFPLSRSSARINYEFIYNLLILGLETFHVLLETRAWRLLSRPPGILF